MCCKYPQIFVDIKKICEYPHNEYPHGYGYRYGADIYPADRVRGSYYLYPTRLVDIPTSRRTTNHKKYPQWELKP